MESGKNTWQHKNYRPVVNLWSSVRIKFVVIIVTILLVVITSVAAALAIAIIRPYKIYFQTAFCCKQKYCLIILSCGFKIVFKFQSGRF